MDENNNMNENQQPQYSQPVPPVNNTTYVQMPPAEEVSSVGDWVLTIFLTTIPCVGLIMLFVWAFGGSAKKSKSNWAKAQLIWALIWAVLGILAYVFLGAALIELANTMS